MTGGLSGKGSRVPDYGREIADLRADIRRLSLALSARPRYPSVQEFIPFSWSGDVSGAKLSGPYHAPSDLTIGYGTLGCAVTGGTTTAALLLNGVTAYTFTLPAGQSGNQELVRVPVTWGTAIQLYVIGGGVSDFTAVMGFVRDSVAIQ